MEQSNSKSIPMSSWALDDIPSYKLKHKGLGAISDSELLSILIGSGTKEDTALGVARNLLASCQNNLFELGKLSLSDMRKVKGIGESKAIMLMAAIEIGRRRYSAIPIDKICIKNSSEIAEFLKVKFQDLNYEIFAVIHLNRANKIKHFEVISKGGITGTVCDIRLILKSAIEQEATSIILCHNHPSGNVRPSRADEEITNKIKQAASYLDLKVLDHLVISSEGYMSFCDEGLL